MIRKAVSVIISVIFFCVTLRATFGNGFSWHGDGEISNHQNLVEKNRVKNATETETIGIEQIGSQMTHLYRQKDGNLISYYNLF